MASPFRQNKKARQRQRKLAKRLLDEKVLAKWDGATADTIRKIAKSTLKQAKAKRRKNRPQNPK
jgi:outer membrane protein TolC